MRTPSHPEETQDLKPWAAVALMVTLVGGGARWCGEAPKVDPPESAPVTRVSEEREATARRARKIRPATRERDTVVHPEVVLPQGELIYPKNVLLPVMNCIRDPQDAICMTPDDPRMAECFTLKEEGAVSVRIDATGQDAILVWVGATAFEYPIDPDDEAGSLNELSEACRTARRWLSTGWEDVGRGVICHGMEETPLKCDDYSKQLQHRGTFGVKIKKMADEFEAELKGEGLDFIRTSHSTFLVDGTVSVGVRYEGEWVGFYVYSNLLGGDPNKLILEKEYAILEVLGIMNEQLERVTKP